MQLLLGYQHASIFDMQISHNTLSTQQPIAKFGLELTCLFNLQQAVKDIISELGTSAPSSPMQAKLGSKAVSSAPSLAAESFGKQCGAHAQPSESPQPLASGANLLHVPTSSTEVTKPAGTLLVNSPQLDLVPTNPPAPVLIDVSSGLVPELLSAEDSTTPSDQPHETAGDLVFSTAQSLPSAAEEVSSSQPSTLANEGQPSAFKQTSSHSADGNSACPASSMTAISPEHTIPFLGANVQPSSNSVQSQNLALSSDSDTCSSLLLSSAAAGEAPLPDPLPTATPPPTIAPAFPTPPCC